MAQSLTDTGIFDVLAEIEDLYGKAPEEAQHLVEVMVIRRRLQSFGIVALSGSVVENEVRLGLSFIPQPLVDPKALAALVQRQPKQYRLLPSGRLMLTVPAKPDLSPMEFLREVREALGRLPILAVGG